MSSRKKGRSKVRRVAARVSLDRRSVVLRSVGFVGLLAVITFSGLQLADAAHDMRGLYRDMGEVQKSQDEALAEHSRLLLERSALASLNNIEQVAEQELDMQFPAEVGEVLE